MKYKNVGDKYLVSQGNQTPPTPNSPTPNSPTPNSPTPNSPTPNSPTPNSPTLNSPTLNSPTLNSPIIVEIRGIKMPYITDFYVVSTLVLFLLLNGILLFFLLRKITSFEKIYVEKITETNEYLKKLIVENKKLNKSEEEKI